MGIGLFVVGRWVIVLKHAFVLAFEEASGMYLIYSCKKLKNDRSPTIAETSYAFRILFILIIALIP